MSEMINIEEILKDCPKGTKLYSLIHGEVTFLRIDNSAYPIVTNVINQEVSFTSYGKWLKELPGECMLFPSKDQRDWTKFKELESLNDYYQKSELEITAEQLAAKLSVLGYKGKLTRETPFFNSTVSDPKRVGLYIETLDIGA